MYNMTDEEVVKLLRFRCTSSDVYVMFKFTTLYIPTYIHDSLCTHIHPRRPASGFRGGSSEEGWEGSAAGSILGGSVDGEGSVPGSSRPRSSAGSSRATSSRANSAARAGRQGQRAGRGGCLTTRCNMP